MNGGSIVAAVLKSHHVQFIFTVSGGHISPILVESHKAGIRVIDTRMECTAVFAADAVSRLSGTIGVAVTTAGPGVTNTVTAIKNAQMAQSPLVLIGGAAATVLRGRGALQDIDQMELMRPLVKWAKRAQRVREIGPIMEEAFQRAAQGTPGPVFIELPIDLLYDETDVRSMYNIGGGTSLAAKAQKRYLEYHVSKIFQNADSYTPGSPRVPFVPAHDISQLKRAAIALDLAKRPIILIGSQAVADTRNIPNLIQSIERLQVPVYLSGMARGLLGAEHPLQIRHKRREALREADFVMLAGVPADFRLDYGRHIPAKAVYISANRSYEDLHKNRQPSLSLYGDAAQAVIGIARLASVAQNRGEWLQHLQNRDSQRNAEIIQQSSVQAEYVNPLDLCRKIDEMVTPNTILIGDGGDFVATASYIVRPQGPLRWLDPGVYGTLGVGAGFALGAKLTHPEMDTVVLFGDGAFGYSCIEFDTFVRHNLPIIAVIGNDAAWSQIAREQIAMLHDDTAVILARTRYDAVAEGFGAKGIYVERQEDTPLALEQALRYSRNGKACVVNVQIGATDFRKGSISM